MAVYKIPQNVEADDKFVGPLSFKQFIYIGIAVVAGYLSFLSLTRGFWPALVFFVPVITVTGFLGFPWGRDQPTEIWLAARIRFLIKPRVRIWNQSGVKELVTITVPKRVEKHYTDGLSLTEVSSRLNGLATLLDSRGWAVKNASSSVYESPLTGVQQNNDRLLDMTTLPQEVSEVGTDILDETSNETALHFEEMIKDSEQKHRQEALDKLNAARMPQQQAPTQPQQQADFWYLQQGAQQGMGQASPQPMQAAQPYTQANIPQQAQQSSSDFWFLNNGGGQQQQSQNLRPAQQPLQQAMPQQPPLATFNNSAVVAPQAQVPPQTQQQQTAQYAQPYAQPAIAPAPYSTLPPQISQADEQAFLEQVHQHQQTENEVAQYGHLKRILPLSEQAELAKKQAEEAAVSPVTAPVNPAIMNLANNDDLNIATLQREAHKQEVKNGNDEIVISLR